MRSLETSTGVFNLLLKSMIQEGVSPHSFLFINVLSLIVSSGQSQKFANFYYQPSIKGLIKIQVGKAGLLGVYLYVSF